MKTSNLRVHFVASFFFLSLARLLLFTSIARFSIERKKTSCFTTTRRTNHAEHNSKTCVSRLKKNALALKRHANETVPFENLLDNKDDGAKDAVVHIVADILIYICCERGGEMCRKTSKRGSHLKRKKKENRGGGCHFGKKRLFWRINTQEKDEELCDFEDDFERERAKSTRE